MAEIAGSTPSRSLDSASPPDEPAGGLALLCITCGGDVESGRGVQVPQREEGAVLAP